MNIGIRLVFVAVRAALIALGTLLVQKGLLSQSAADMLSGDAAIWIASGAFVLLGAVAHEAWEKVKHFALTQLALMFPAGTPAGTIVKALPFMTRRSWWFLAKRLAETKVSAEDAKRLDEAQIKVIEALQQFGWSDRKSGKQQ